MSVSTSVHRWLSSGSFDRSELVEQPVRARLSRLGHGHSAVCQAAMDTAVARLVRLILLPRGG